MTIRVQTEINATPDRVWDVISDLDNEPKFWRGTKSIRNISKDKNTITREITIAFRDQKCLQRVNLYPKERIETVFTRGIIDGNKTVMLKVEDGKTILLTHWDIRLTGMMSVFTGIIRRHIRDGTEQAMQSIKAEIEG